MDIKGPIYTESRQRQERNVKVFIIFIITRVVDFVWKIGTKAVSKDNSSLLWLNMNIPKGPIHTCDLLGVNDCVNRSVHKIVESWYTTHYWTFQSKQKLTKCKYAHLVQYNDFFSEFFTQ